MLILIANTVVNKKKKKMPTSSVIPSYYEPVVGTALLYTINQSKVTLDFDANNTDTGL
jgi:hypothetical protein